MSFNNSFGLPGAYLGVKSPTPANFQEYNRLPTANDWQGYTVGANWLYVPNAHLATGRRLFRLFSLVGNQALWVEVTAGGGTVVTLTGNDVGNPVAPDGLGNINIITANATVKVLGTPVNFTETINFGLTNLILGSSSPSIAGAILNVGVGLNALSDLTTGSSNSAIGAGSLLHLTTGNRNTAIGNSTLNALATGSDNTALGDDALQNFTASQATAVGSGALAGAVTGNNNVAVGFNSLLVANTGDENTALGSGTLEELTTASFNTAVGYGALSDVITGQANTALGVNAGTNYTTTESSNLVLGNIGVTNDNNTIRIGQQGAGLGQQNKCFIAGIVGVSVSNAQTVVINSATGQLGIGAGGSGPIEKIAGNDNTSVSPNGSGVFFIKTANSTAQFLSGIANQETIDFARTTNVIVGDSLPVLAGGTDNTGIGYFILDSVTSGVGNVAVGSLSLQLLTTGASNIGVGSGSLGHLTSGDDNVGLGDNALLNLTTGSGNVVVGNSGSAYTGSESNNILLGQGITGVLGESRTTRIGTGVSNSATACYVSGIYGSTVGGTNAAVIVDNNGKLGTQAVAVGNGLIFIQTQTAVGVSALNFTASISAPFNNFLLLFNSLNCPTASSDTCNVQISTNSGVSYINTGYTNASGSTIGLTVASLSDGNVFAGGSSTLSNLTSGAGYVMSTGTIAAFQTVGPSFAPNAIGAAYNTVSTTANAFRVTIDGVKLFSGTFTLYGFSQ